MIKVGVGQTVEERLGKIEQSINRSPVILPFAIIDDSGGGVSVPVAPGQFFGGVLVDRSWSRTVLPDRQWVVRAAGFINPTDANGVTIDLNYTSDALATTSLGSVTLTGAGVVKARLGPFDVFATGGVPSGETIPAIRLRAIKLVSGTATILHWDIWLELRASRT
jgi:hypothetical protein